MAEEEFKISQKEADQLREAFKKPEFCKLLSEYAQEIADPENKKKYEEELVALEKQRGVDMKYIHPQPGFVLKTFLKPDCTRKLFINMCSSDVIQPASSKPASRTSKRSKGDHWNIPYSLTPSREDLDKAKNRCTVVDVIFHTDIFKKAKEVAQFKRMLVDSALEGLERQLSLVVDRSRIVYLYMPYKGVPSPAVIRTKNNTGSQEEENPLNIPFPPLLDETEKSSKGSKSRKSSKRVKEGNAAVVTEPKYSVVHRGEFSMQDYTNERCSSLVRRPKELVVEVQLPGVSSVANLEVDIFKERVKLHCKSPCYDLDLALAYLVEEEHSKAKFDKSTHILTLTLPVLPPKTPLPQPFSPPNNPTPDPNNEGTTQNEEECTIPLLSSEESGSAPAACFLSSENKVAKDGSSLVEEVSDAVGIDCGERLTSLEAVSDVEQLDEGGGSRGSSSQVEGLPSEVWSSSKHLACPPFSYRQDDSTVVFCLHTPGGKEGSVVKVFEKNHVQLTYSTETAFYSFHVTFPHSCVLDIDDCTVDMSQQNLVLLLKKEEPEEGCEGCCLWEKCYVGPDASRTQEKLFLTESNVFSVVHSLPDPWNQSRWSDQASVKTSCLADQEQISVTISDPPMNCEESSSDGTPRSPMEQLPMPQPLVINEVDVQSDTNAEQYFSIDPKTESTTAESCSDGKSVSGTSSDPGCVSEDSSEAVAKGASSDVALGNKSVPEAMKTEALTSVRLEDDGSVFIRADENYLKDRDNIVPLIGGKSSLEPHSTHLQVSNDLLYSLD